MSRGQVPDPQTRSLEVRYRTPSQSYEDCLEVREYITMGVYWIISLYFRDILFCEYEIFVNDLKSLFIMLWIHFKLIKMGTPQVTQFKICAI